MKLAYYPGCSLDGTGVEYGKSTRAVFARLGVELEDLPGWTCCGATSAHATSSYLSVALPLRNLSLAEALGRDVLVPCAACFNAMRRAGAAARAVAAGGGSEEERHVVREVAAATGRACTGKFRAVHPLEFLSAGDGASLLKSRIARPLDGLRIAPYYGCLLLRPAREIGFDDPERPQSMGRVLRALGAEPVTWSGHVDCCGASLGISSPDLVTILTVRLQEQARRAGAAAIVTACPLCQTNLEGRGGKSRLPVFFITELVGLALGLKTTRSWLRRHLVNPFPLLRSLKLA